MFNDSQVRPCCTRYTYPMYCLYQYYHINSDILIIKPDTPTAHADYFPDKKLFQVRHIIPEKHYT